VRAAQPSLHGRAAGLGAEAGSEEGRLPRSQGRDSIAAASALGLPFPSALPACDAALPRRTAAAEGSRAAPFFGLPPERHDVSDELIGAGKLTLGNWSFLRHAFSYSD